MPRASKTSGTTRKKATTKKATASKTSRTSSRSSAATRKKAPVKRATKAEVEAPAFNPYANVDDAIDNIEKDFSLTNTGMDKTEKRMSTGLLTLDLVLGGGIVGGGWYTSFGPEQSCKSTGAVSFMTAALNTDVPILSYWDYEGSVDASYLENIMRTNGIRTPVEKVFGIRDEETRQWVVKPRVRYYSETIAEKFFDYLSRLQRELPDKIKMGDDWYYVYPHTKTNKSKFAGMYDTTYFKQTNKFRIPAPDGNMQALVIVDSYPAMLPEGQDDDDPSKAMALQARMFSEQLKRVKGRLRAKRIAVVGVNQLRLRPAVMFGCFHGSSKVMMADGSEKYIEDLVRTKDRGPVMSYNPVTGKPEPKHLVGWYDNGKTSEWLQFKCSGATTPNSLTQFKCTPNHLLRDGNGKMRRASTFKEGDTLTAVSYVGETNEWQKQVLLGSVLGDGWFIRGQTGRVGMAFAHRHEDLSYTEFKGDVLKPIVTSSYRDGEKDTVETMLLAEPWFNKVYLESKAHHQGRQYSYSETLMQMIDERGLAIWYMDDAAKNRSVIKCQSFSESDTARMSKAINRKFSCSTEVVTWKDKHTKSGRGWGIKLDEKLLSLIIPHVLNTFADRITCKVAKPYLPMLDSTSEFWSNELGPFYSHTVEVRSITEGRPTSQQQGRHFGKSKYDLEVEHNHLYVVNGAVVHNSPEYEPGGEALKFFSDVRLKWTPRALSSVISGGKGMIMEEDSVTHEGKDQYRFIHCRAHKNKLSTPYLETMVRLWIEDATGKARGFDIVWDTYEYLKATGQVTGTRNNLRVSMPGLEGVKLKWFNFKSLCLLTGKDLKAECDGLGLDKAINLRKLCEKQCSTKGIELRNQHKQESLKKSSGSDEDDD